MLNTLRYFIISLFCFSGFIILNAQTKQTKDTVNVKFFQGFRLELDASPLANYFIYNGERLNFEGGIYVDLKKKYYPAFELGYGKGETLTNAAASFNSKGVYTRFGLDINLIKPAKDQLPTNNVFFAGVRLAYSPFKYNYTDFSISNDYWGEAVSTNIIDKSYSFVWYEVLAGIRTEIAPKIYMGWTVRIKNMIGVIKPGAIVPCYIPGYGVKTENPNWGINYSIGYKF